MGIEKIGAAQRRADMGIQRHAHIAGAKHKGFARVVYNGLCRQPLAANSGIEPLNHVVRAFRHPADVAAGNSPGLFRRQQSRILMAKRAPFELPLQMDDGWIVVI